MADRLRVLHVGKYYPPHEGGMESHLQQLARRLAPGVDVSVVVASSSRRGSVELDQGIPIERVPTLATVASTPLCPGMVRAIRRSGADVVHVHHPNPSAFAAWMASGSRAPLVVTYHSDVVAQRLLNRLYDPLVRHVLGRSAAIIATSPRYVETSPVLRDFAAKCEVIPMAVEPEPFLILDARQQAEVARIRAEHGPRIVLTVGRLVYYKGLEYLLRAMRSVDARLLVVGQGPLRGDLEREAARLGVADRVVFVGKAPDVVPYVHACDVFALASVARSEAFGIVQLEAMAAGRPVVNTAIPSGVPWVSPHGVTGLTVPAADPDALAAAIVELVDDPGRRIVMGEAARRRVLEQFTVEAIARRTTALYERVVGSARDRLRTAVPAA